MSTTIRSLVQTCVHICFVSNIINITHCCATNEFQRQRKHGQHFTLKSQFQTFCECLLARTCWISNDVSPRLWSTIMVIRASIHRSRSLNPSDSIHLSTACISLSVQPYNMLCITRHNTYLELICQFSRSRTDNCFSSCLVWLFPKQMFTPPLSHLFYLNVEMVATLYLLRRRRQQQQQQQWWTFFLFWNNSTYIHFSLVNTSICFCVLIWWTVWVLFCRFFLVHHL